MTCFTKETILEAYKTLSEMHPDPTVQGATQKVSAIRHFLALDAFHHKYHHNCDTRNNNDKKEFVNAVGGVCDVCQDFYTTNFYYPLKKHSGDFCVGSNFYSAGQVSASLVNPQETFNYPKRGDKPLFQIKNGVLLRNIKLYENFKDYVETVRYRAALAIWLLRNLNVKMGFAIFDAIKIGLEGIYTPELIDILMAEEDHFAHQLDLFNIRINGDIDVHCAPLTQIDITKLFSKKKLSPSFNDKILPFLPALRTKPFLLLAGISGTGKSRIVKEMAFASCPDEAVLRKDKVTPGNYCLVEVKPNWNDSTELLGYETMLNSGGYHLTPFVKFLVKAMQYPDVPFFVCLDEMNLAPVEQYFAEFLSVLESRKDIDGDIKTEPLIDASVFVKYEDKLHDELFPSPQKGKEEMTGTYVTDESTKRILNSYYLTLEEEGLRIPRNLIVVGTVNMDDTTYQFSRKVIDRAMTIEMNEVNLDKMLEDNAPDTLQYPDEAMDKERFLAPYAQSSKALASPLMEKDKAELIAGIKSVVGQHQQDGTATENSLESILGTTPFRIAYRVVNELILHFAALRQEKDDAEFGELFCMAVDDILMMKVLPRIEGNEDLVKKPLDALERWTEGRYPHSHKKIKEMQERLHSAHFTSYWP